jgi:hypothetical protein
LTCHLRENPSFYNNPDLKASLANNSKQQIEQRLMEINYANRDKLDEVALKIDYNFNYQLKSIQPYLTSSQIEKLISDGFHFGAHSIDHPEYRFLPFEEQVRQTKESINYVRLKFSLDYNLFAFPFTDYGVSNEFFKTIASNEIVDISFGCAGLKKELQPLHFQRIAFERGKLSASQIYKSEVLYSGLLNLLGKNVIQRA